MAQQLLRLNESFALRRSTDRSLRIFMIHFNSFLRRLVAALLGLALMAGIGHAQTAFDNSSAQDAWNYSGTMVQRSSYSSELRCVTTTADGVYVGVLDGSYYIEKYDHSGAFVSRFTRAFSTLVGVASSKTGDVYGFDASGKGYAFSPSGVEKFSFGLGYGNGDGYFSSFPGDTYTAIGVDSVGQIYVVDFYNYRVQVFNADGSFKSKIGTYGSLPGQFPNGARSVALGPQDEVLVLDDSRYVTKFDTAGNYKAKTSQGPEPWNYYSQLAFAVSSDGQLLEGVLPNWYGYLASQLVNITTMYSDRWRGDYYQSGQAVGRVFFFNSPSGNENYVRGAAFDAAANIWMVRYNSAVSGGWTLERYERRMRFDNYKPTKGLPLPLVLSAAQQAGNPSVDISYRVDQSFIGGGTVSAGGTVTGGSIMSGGSVTTALVGWMGGTKNWSHLVVPSVGSGTHAASGAYFWSDMYDLSTRIDGRYPLQDWARSAAVDAAGNVYVIADYCIRKISPSGNVTTLAGLAGYSGYSDANGATARFHNPWSICVDANGNVFVTEREGRVIRKITPTGDVTTLAGSWTRYSNTDGVGQNAGFYTPGQITVDTSGSLYLAQWDASCSIRKISQSGSVTTVGSPGQNIEGIAVDANGAIYVAALYSHKILKVVPDGTATGIVTTFAGSGNYGHLDGNGTNATFWNPRGLGIGPDGNLYVTEDQGNLIRMITPNGDVTTIGKTGDLVYNVAVDAAGSLYAPGSSTTAGIGGRMVRKGTRSASTSFGIGVSSGSLGAGVQTGTVQTVKWDVAQDMPGMSFASLSFEIIAKAAGPEIGAHFITIPSDSTNASDLRISNRPIDESDLGDLWLWLLANRDPRLAISGNSVIMTQAGLDYISDAPRINDSDATDTSNIAHTGGTGGANGDWNNWGNTTDRGRAFAYKYLNYRPVTGSDITRANAGRYNLNTVNNYSAVNLAP